MCSATASLAAGSIPKPDHVVIVMEENHGYSEIIGSQSAPYINSLATQGALFTNSYAIGHPSQPNYLELFSGSNQGVTDDSCPHSFGADNEGNQLITAGYSFAGYSESLPAKGSGVCNYGAYARKHAPWTNFTDLPAKTNLPFTSFSKAFNKANLPTVSWVIPNLNDDMHDGTIAQGDAWLKANIKPYVDWVQTHNSLLIVTWDEDDGGQGNHIATIFVGPMVKPGQYAEQINHYRLLRTIETMYGLAGLGNAAKEKPIKDVWQ
ncbi:MAG: acid phosphatase [Alphaproteobacteria bacterium]|nr:acid phosphatase [Alphaproteobacteria bacterium]MBV9062262.1 acid phosphatase [Alphaproteobacteria bacterium]